MSTDIGISFVFAVSCRFVLRCRPSGPQQNSTPHPLKTSKSPISQNITFGCIYIYIDIYYQSPDWRTKKNIYTYCLFWAIVYVSVACCRTLFQFICLAFALVHLWQTVCFDYFWTTTTYPYYLLFTPINYPVWLPLAREGAATASSWTSLYAAASRVDFGGFSSILHHTSSVVVVPSRFRIIVIQGVGSIWNFIRGFADLYFLLGFC